jgi:tRNA nucleotidyltransferase (CCA-adding enzyme)
LSELKLILNEPDPLEIIIRMNELGLLKFISPDIRLTEQLRNLLEEIREVIVWYHLLYLEEPLAQWKVYWYGLASPLKMAQFNSLNKEMGVSQKGLHLRKTGERLLESLFRFDGTNYQLYTLLLPYDTETLLYLMARARNEKMKRLISFYFTRLKGTRILIDGKDLLNMGLKSGPVFKEVFDSLLEARVNNITKTRDDELRFVKDTFGDLLHERDM